MSTELFPLAVWASGTNQNSIPANDNSLRVQVLFAPAISVANAAPGSPAEDDVHVVGTAWGGFATDDVVLYKGGTWLGFEPFDGWVKTIAGALSYYDSGWVSGVPSGSIPEPSVTALSIASGVVNIDCDDGDYFTLSLTANVTSITFSNLPAAGKAKSIAVRVRQDGTGGRTVALPSSFKATGGSDTAVQSAANAYTLLTITSFDQGTRWEYAMQEIAA